MFLVTEQRTNTPLLLNDRITKEIVPFQGGSKINRRDGAGSYRVNETPDWIFENNSGNQLLKLTTPVGVVLVHKDDIQVITEISGGGSKIEIVNSRNPYTATETLAQIQAQFPQGDPETFYLTDGTITDATRSVNGDGSNSLIFFNFAQFGGVTASSSIFSIGAEVTFEASNLANLIATNQVNLRSKQAALAFTEYSDTANSQTLKKIIASNTAPAAVFQTADYIWLNTSNNSLNIWISPNWVELGGADSLVRFFATTALAKAATDLVDNQMVYIANLGRWYFATQVPESEDPPFFRIIETSSSDGGNPIKLKRANNILYNTFRDDEGIRIQDEVGIGTIPNGKELVVGEGDSTTEGMLVYSFNGSTYTDITAQASEATGSPFSFANNVAGNAIYVCITQQQNGIKYTPKGIKVKMNTAGDYQKGEITFEYFTGVTFSPLNVMSIRDQDGYNSNANVPFQVGNGESEQIYFNNKSHLDWEENDPPSVGTIYKWFKIELKATVATLPIFEQIKIHTSRFEANKDGFTQKFGDARPSRFLNWKVTDLIAANNSPSNQDLYLLPTVGVGRAENLFVNGAVDRSGLNIRLPKDVDTSSPIKMRFTYRSSSGAGGDIRFIVRTSYSKDGDETFTTAAGAPITSPNLREYPIIIPMEGVGEGIQKTTVVEIDVSDLNPNPVSGEEDADVLWLTFERTGNDVADTHAGNIAMIQIDARYTAWADGGYATEANVIIDTVFSENWASGDFSQGWVRVASGVSANAWEVGTATSSDPPNACYISTDGGTTATYNSSTPDTVTHLYIDNTIPSTVKAIRLKFDRFCVAEDGAGQDDFDFMRVFAVATTFNPVADTLPPISSLIGELKYVDDVGWTASDIEVPSSFIGQDLRVIFSFKCDFSIENNPGSAIDNIQLITIT